MASMRMMITSYNIQPHPCGNPTSPFQQLAPPVSRASGARPTRVRNPPPCPPLLRRAAAGEAAAGCEASTRRIVSPPLRDHPWTRAFPRPLAQSMPSTQASRAAVPPLGPGPHKPSGRTGARRPAAPAGSATTWARAAGQVGIRLSRANPIRRHKVPGRPPALESGRCDTLPVRCHSGWPGATADAHEWAAAGGRRTVRRGRAGGD